MVNGFWLHNERRRFGGGTGKYLEVPLCLRHRRRSIVPCCVYFLCAGAGLSHSADGAFCGQARRKQCGRCLRKDKKGLGLCGRLRRGRLCGGACLLLHRRRLGDEIPFQHSFGEYPIALIFLRIQHYGGGACCMADGFSADKRHYSSIRRIKGH